MIKTIALEIQKSEVTVDSLRIRAKLSNNESSEIFYVAHLCRGSDDEGVPILELTPAYRVVSQEKVRLIRSFIPVPDNVGLEIVRYPLFASLKVGGTVDINFDLPLPTYPYTPYDFEEFDKKSAKPKSLAWTLEIGFISGKNFLAEDPKEVTTTTGEKGFQVFSIDESSIQSVKYSSGSFIPVLTIQN
jgi:hypothetical protein